MSETKYKIIITSKKAQHHIAKIKAEHEKLLEKMDLHKQKKENDKLLKQQGIQQEQMRRQGIAEQLRQRHLQDRDFSLRANKQ